MKNRSKKLNLKEIQDINLSSVKSVLNSSQALEQEKSLAHLRWLADFRIRHQFDLRNLKLFKQYLSLTKKLRRFETKHARSFYCMYIFNKFFT